MMIKILENVECADCGWPVIDAVCRGDEKFSDYKDAVDWDWWYYCSNKGCKNHDGEGVFQLNPSWVKKVKK